MNFDWLKARQDFCYELPYLGDVGYQRIRLDTGEVSSVSQPVYVHEGSFSDVVSIRIRGSELTMSGNPSRWGKLDNVFGLRTMDDCFDVFNHILRSLGLPEFTKGTCFKLRQMPDGSYTGHVWNGAEVLETHINRNIAVGPGNENMAIRALSVLNFRRMNGSLRPNGHTAEFMTDGQRVNLMYPSIYNKAYDLLIHSMKKTEKKSGKDSEDYKYLACLYEFLLMHGVIRFELKLKRRFLQKNKLIYWGYSDFETELEPLIDEFVNIYKKTRSSSMDVKSVATELLEAGVVDSVRAAHTTAFYAYSWSCGERFDFSKSAVKIHRSRLRKIGIDIARDYNVSLFPGVVIRNIKEIEFNEVVKKPDWYRERKTELYLVA
ncbi:TPA: Replication-associated protein G2P [Escherichia coli]|nr:phage/plasmid replication protein [Escherichia coli]HEL8025982.1 Replication-associated protein G2P [Escherichia coli]HEL8044699.1 Replication-associated protein G2P [Escherichia coli]HEL8049408.1 Replication-associated protein G2P [Escherichia coli]HEL8054243.1 Replication-associated protein G2P [Escherichia coli]